jgi:hypothetical protein
VLVAFAAAPAGAQEELGLETNILEGQPGEIVAGQVDTDDIAEHCVTELEAFQARFQAAVADPNLFNGLSPGGELFDRFFPSGAGSPFEGTETHAQLAYVLTALVFVGIAADFPAGSSADALAQTFVLTFADIETQDPVGEMGNFDPETGEGTVAVPDVQPGQWAVAAACVGPILDDIDAFEAGLRAGGDFLEELGTPVDINDPAFFDFVEEQGFDDEFQWLASIAPDLLEGLVVPDALGAVIFCILDETGECPTDVVPPGPDDDDDDDAEPAPPVMRQPDFTG